MVVIGAGITGLAAAHRIAMDQPDADLVVLEAGTRAGGRLTTSPVVGLPVDEGADAFLVRVPWASDLFAEVDLGEELVSPDGRLASLWLDGVLRPLPTPNVLGVPLDPSSVAQGILGSADLERLAGSGQPNNTLPEGVGPDGDLTVGQVVRACAGNAVFERLVDALLGGINAGKADDLSCDVMAPQLLEAARNPNGLLTTLRDVHREVDQNSPVFKTHPGGMGHLADRLAETLGTALRVGCPVRSLTADGNGWTVHTDRDVESADAVVLATPVTTTAALLAGLCPPAATALTAVEHASVTLVTFAYHRSDAPVPRNQSGFLVPRGEGMLMTACSYVGSKWTHLDDGDHTLLRVSAGRIDDNRPEELDDDALVDALATDLATTRGVEAPPVAVRVSRWPQSLAQFRPGHRARMADVAGQLDQDAPGLVVAGAHHRGVGIPACVHSGGEAAAAVAGRLV
ncbi:MAG: protoporphyrinogen oxidase [Actinomycetota bacterium]|nr:protoporphyrinogen oxidase [Actinomycetota bacterium]